MKKIIGIELTFENVEFHEVPIEAIQSLTLTDISHDLDYDGKYNEYLGKFDQRAYVDDLQLEIDADYLVKGTAGDWDDLTDSCPNLLWRILRYPDITGVEVCFDDNTSQYYMVYWSGNGSVNNAMQCQVTVDGNLKISIGQQYVHDWYEHAYTNWSIDLMSKYLDQVQRMQYLAIVRRVKHLDQDYLNQTLASEISQLDFTKLSYYLDRVLKPAVCKMNEPMMVGQDRTVSFNSYDLFKQLDLKQPRLFMYSHFEDQCQKIVDRSSYEVFKQQSLSFDWVVFAYSLFYPWLEVYQTAMKWLADNIDDWLIGQGINGRVVMPDYKYGNRSVKIEVLGSVNR